MVLIHVYSHQVLDGKDTNEGWRRGLCLYQKLLRATAVISVTLLTNSIITLS
jgi:hypothetical protein